MSEEKPVLEKMDVMEIMALLPHRYPFLLVDRIIEIEDGGVIADTGPAARGREAPAGSTARSSCVATGSSRGRSRRPWSPGTAPTRTGSTASSSSVPRAAARRRWP